MGKRERNGPTHTLLMTLRPPAPKNIAFNRQVGKTSLVHDGPLWIRVNSALLISGLFQANADLFCLQLCRRSRCGKV